MPRLTLSDFSTESALDFTTSCPGHHHDGCRAQMLHWRIQGCHLRQSCALLERCIILGVAASDITTTGAELNGFAGGFSDGTYGYLVPYGNGYAKSCALLLRRLPWEGGALHAHRFTTVVVFVITTREANHRGFSDGLIVTFCGYIVPCCNSKASMAGSALAPTVI
jgi:hypothetical protein